MVKLTTVSFLCAIFGYSSSAFLPFFNANSPDTMPECVGDNRACRISTQSYSPSMAFSTLYRNENPICVCSNGASCSNEWDSSSNTTITFFLATRGHRMSVQLRFCVPVAAHRTCEGEEDAAILKASSVMPLEIKRMNCRCPGSDEMHLRSTTQVSRDILQTYGCTHNVCDVSTSRPCMTLSYDIGGPRRTETTTHHCECPSDHSCRIDLSQFRRLRHETSITGYCRRL